MASLRGVPSVCCGSCIVVLVSFAAAQAPPSAWGVHPRLLFSAADLPSLRARRTTEPYASIFSRISSPLDGCVAGSMAAQDWWSLATCLRNNASSYALTGDATFCDVASELTTVLVNTSGLFSNASADSLTRGYVSISVALAYDFCFDAWAPAYDASVSLALLLNGASMYESFDLVDGLGNNHEAVRYASAGLSFLVCDDASACPIRAVNAYDALIGHLRANLGQASLDARGRGWNPEGMGYTAYPWEHTGVFAVAAQRVMGLSLTQDMPPAALSLWTTLLTAIPIPHIPIPGATYYSPLMRGLHADFVDDNPVVTLEGTMGLAFAVSPSSLLPAMRWMYDTYWGSGAGSDASFDGLRGGALYSYLFYPIDTPPVSPAVLVGGAFNDTVYGMALWRRSFASPATAGANDVIVQHSARSRAPFQCHSGADANGWRLIGEGSAWATGSGRTGDPRGQCTLFPTMSPNSVTSGTAATGVFVVPPVFWSNASSVYPSGTRGGYSVVAGSSTNVSNHVRRVVTDFTDVSNGLAGVSAVVMIADTSINGVAWRMNTPAFNAVALGNASFVITAPEFIGSAVYAYVLYPPIGTFSLANGSHPRDVPGDSHAIGFPFYDTITMNNTYIDVIYNDANASAPQFLVVLQVQSAAGRASGQTPPVPILQAAGAGCCTARTVTVGSVSYLINGTIVTLL